MREKGKAHRKAKHTWGEGEPLVIEEGIVTGNDNGLNGKMSLNCQMEGALLEGQ